MDVVITLGGSVISENFDDIGFIVDQIQEIYEKCDDLVVVVGAGDLKRYIECASDDSSNAEKDLIGIRATRLNASLIKSFFPESCGFIPESVDDVERALQASDFVVMGGTEPGHSTDGVGALCAELIDADVFVDVTDVCGVLKEVGNSDSKFDELSFSKLEEVIVSRSFDPGTYCLMDMVALNILKRSDIKTVVVDGNEPGEISGAVNGGHSGTVVLPDDESG